jgi:dissimilatory sulfite reductase (desulfoviridin) alpha/beta subunit
VGLTTREACGDTVRNVMACHLAGACPYEQLDVTPWAEAVYRHFVRNPLGQRLPRKFKVNFSGCSTDCGQAMFNDVGVVAVTGRPRTAGSNTDSASTSPAVWVPPRIRRWPSRTSPPRGAAPHDRGRTAGLRPDGQQ